MEYWNGLTDEQRLVESRPGRAPLPARPPRRSLVGRYQPSSLETGDAYEDSWLGADWSGWGF
ncbi:MAG: hypothetical protein LBG06_01295 [Deltaproteobacteria bacterium]|nr:hypothetical protein [Deltaproteobacteria bacterium]